LREISPFVYIMANQRNGTIYVGVTSNLIQRIGQHRAGVMPAFTKQYGLKWLVWCEPHTTMENAIAREKQIKGGSVTGNWRLLREKILIGTI